MNSQLQHLAEVIFLPNIFGIDIPNHRQEEIIGYVLMINRASLVYLRNQRDKWFTSNSALTHILLS